MGRTSRLILGLVSPLITLTFLSTASASETKAAHKNEQVWQFDCQHFGSGKFRYLVAPNAIRIVNLSSGGIVLCKAPKWQVSCFRESEKIEWFSTLDRFDAATVLSSSTSSKAKKVEKFEVMEKDELLGLKCLKYKLSDDSKVWVAEDLKTAPPINELVTRYFRTPAVGGIPLKIEKKEKGTSKPTVKSEEKAKLQKAIPWLSVKNLRGKPADNCYVTLTDWKRIPYKDSDYEYPKGYKRTDNLKDVLVSQKSRQALEDLVEGLSQ